MDWTGVSTSFRDVQLKRKHAPPFGKYPGKTDKLLRLKLSDYVNHVNPERKHFQTNISKCKNVVFKTKEKMAIEVV